MTEQRAVTAPLREPTEREKVAIAKAREKLRRRSERGDAPALAHASEGATAKVRQPHADGVGWNDQLHATLGTTSAVFANHLSGQMALASAIVGNEAGASLEAGLAFMSGVDPQNEAEAALGAQMWAVHAAGMEMTRRMIRATDVASMEAYGRLSTKLTRTFAAQAEALAKLRTGGKQQVEVRYIHIDARGSQNVIAAGGGGELENGRQGFGPSSLESPPTAPGPEVWSENAPRNVVPITSDTRQEALPHPRRKEPGRTQR